MPIMFKMHVSRVMVSNPFPSIIFLSDMRDMRVMHIIRVMRKTLLLQ